eukprot:CAMPEP_0117556530 /NCGR_PEP_ID=MMETSP0784-20121206/51857_1 /TAXON_ID=39447 /ORGANISM="" /LENGTH=577 /DNA_ID=CAMNT_0005353809 /DNA_START=10 /DNA_END=1740 /DNA_ORIENTATION=+
MAVTLPSVHHAQGVLSSTGGPFRKPTSAKTLKRSCSSPAMMTSRLALMRPMTGWASPTQTMKASKQEQVQRLVHLYGIPRDGPSGTANSKWLAKAFPFRGYIKGGENRGVTPEQIEQVHRYAEAHCRDWKLEMDEVNLYHVNTWIIGPSTKAAESAMTEHLTDTEQPPAWFVSHWWGEPVALFVRCLWAHAATRGSDGVSSVFWVCAYANRQHALQNSIGEDPRQSIFYKALQTTRFKVLLVLDTAFESTGPATPFARAWCALEFAMCLDQATLMIDVANCAGEQIYLLTDGLTKAEKTREKYHPGAGLADKARRETTFPNMLIQAALSFNIKLAKSSVAEDRRRILNLVAQRDLDLDPVEEHENYDELNQRLRCLFALAFWHQAISSERPKHPGALKAHMEMLKNLTIAIRGDLRRKSLHMALAGVTLTDEDSITLVSECFPPNLVSLTLNLLRTGTTDAGLETLALRLPASLKSLSLNFTECEGITDQGVGFLVQKLPEEIESLNVVLAGTKVQNYLPPGSATLNMLYGEKRLKREAAQRNASTGDRKEERHYAQGSEYAWAETLRIRKPARRFG